MSSNSVDPSAIKVGASVVSTNGEVLGQVREVYPHFLLVARSGEHQDLEVPMHSVLSVSDGRVHTSVNRDSTTKVDDVETAHRLIEGQEKPGR
jgi:hypothetical protein